jgi:hypothetical protein
MKHPSPTPPHKGEGLGGRIAYPLSHLCNKIGVWQSGQVSPSPLWGGVGEGFQIS